MHNFIIFVKFHKKLRANETIDSPNYLIASTRTTWIRFSWELELIRLHIKWNIGHLSRQKLHDVDMDKRISSHPEALSQPNCKLSLWGIPWQF